MPGFPLIYVNIWATKTSCSCSAYTLQTTPHGITSPLSQRYQWQHPTQDLCTAGWPLICLLIQSLSGLYFQTHKHLKSCQLKRLLFCDFLGSYIKEKHWSRRSPNLILQEQQETNSGGVLVMSFINLKNSARIKSCSPWCLLSYQIFTQRHWEIAQNASFLNILPRSKCWQVLERDEEILWKIIAVLFIICIAK